MFKLVLKQKSDDVLCLTLSNTYRFLFIGMCFLLAVLMLMDIGSGTKESNPVPLIFFCVCLLAACYCDRWIFDRKQMKVEKHFGFIFLFKRKSIPLDEVRSFTTSRFARFRPEMTEEVPKKGAFQKDYATLALVTTGDKVKTLEIARGRHKPDLVKKAQQIASFCSKPFQ